MPVDGGEPLSPQAELGDKSKPAQTALAGSHAGEWLRFLLPSVSDLLFVLLLVSLTVGSLAPRLLGDAGTGWHIRNGELILHTHSITRTDPFSATMNGRPWYAWEWLYDAGIAAIHLVSGLNGVVFLTALVIASTFTLTFRLALRQGAALPVALGLLILAIGASAIHLFARPHVLSWLLALTWFAILDSCEAANGEARRLFWLPALMLLWVNLHGGFVMGFALCGIYLLAALVGVWRAAEGGERGRARAWFRHLSLVTGASVLAGLVNPFGYRLYFHVYQYLSDRFLMNHIDEFRSPDFHGAAQQCFAALLLITIGVVAVVGRKLRTSQLLVVILAAYSGLYASRNLPVSSILLTLILAPALTQELATAAEDRSMRERVRNLVSSFNAFCQRMGDVESGFRRHFWPAIAVVLGMVLCAHQGKLGSRQLMNARFDGKRFPVSAADWIAKQDVHDPLFSPDYWGGYLIYRFYPKNQVFIDDRHDFYGDAFLKRYLKIVHAEPGWDAELKSIDPNWILLPRESTLTNILKEVPQWKVVYEDRTATVFTKQTVGHQAADHPLP